MNRMKHAHPNDGACLMTGPKDEDLCVGEIRQGQQMMRTCVSWGIIPVTNNR